MNITTRMTMVATAMVLLGGCAAGGGPQLQGSHAKGEAAVGAGIGALIGGLIGHKEGNTAAGALIGGLLGGAVGYLHGREEDLARARALAAQARKDGYVARVQSRTVTDPRTHAPVQVFRGFQVAMPVQDIAQRDSRSLTMLSQCGALALKERTDVTAVGPNAVRGQVVNALNLPTQRIHYDGVGSRNVYVKVLASQG